MEIAETIPAIAERNEGDALFEFARKEGYTQCKSRITNKYKILYEIQQNPTKWKQHPIYTHLWFEKNTSRCFDKKSRGGPRGGLTGLSTLGRASPSIQTNGKVISHLILKWKLFNGIIPENHIIIFKNETLQKEKLLSLENLECVPLSCKMCNKKIIKNPNPQHQSLYCSIKCRGELLYSRKKERYKSDLEQCIKCRIKPWKKSVSYEYCLNLYEKAAGCCYWCGIKSILYGGEMTDAGPYNPSLFSFDAVIASAGHIYGNLVISCALCNTMKHAMGLLMWLKLLTFLKTEGPAVLDLSEYSFINKNKKIKGQVKSSVNPWAALRRDTSKYYTARGSPFKTFREIFKKQKGVDGIFHFYPLVWLDAINYFNVSCDAIDASLDKEEKHRPNNIELIPQFLNYGKNSLTNKQFIEAFKKRGFRTDYTDCKVNLPDKYKSESWLEDKIQTNKRSGKGRKGIKNSVETRAKISMALKGRSALNKKKVNMIDPKTNEIIKSFDSQQDAASYVKGSISSISQHLNKKQGKIYRGYKWQYAEP